MRRGVTKLKKREIEAGGISGHKTIKKHQGEQRNKGVKKESVKSQSIAHLTVGQDQDPSAVKAFPLFNLQYKAL